MVKSIEASKADGGQYAVVQAESSEALPCKVIIWRDPRIDKIAKQVKI